MTDSGPTKAGNQTQKRLLYGVLALSLTMFVVEFIAAIISNSSSLLADSLDMLADALVYAISLYALNRTLRDKAKAALFNGALQLFLASLLLLEIGRRFIFGSAPEAETMFMIAALAMVVNISCFLILYRFRNGDINLRAALTFSAIDLIGDCGVLVAAGLVSYTGSAWPDQLIGFLIAAMIFYMATSIIRGARKALKSLSAGEDSQPVPVYSRRARSFIQY